MKTAIVAGCRTPFSKAGTSLRRLTAIDLGKVAVREVLARADVGGEEVDELVYGTVVHDPHAPNIAREVGIAVLPDTVPAFTVSRACASSNQAITDGAGMIELGYADVVVAGGAESLSQVPITVSEEMAESLISASRAKSLGQRVKAFAGIRPKHFLPRQPAIAEPSTGLTMGESAELMAKMNGIPREEQDRWALRSHRLAAEADEDGRLREDIAPVYPPPEYDEVVKVDNGIRRDTSMEKLEKLPPVFDREHGSVTAGNSSPLTDGASAVVLMSEERARSDGRNVLGYIRSWAWAALDPGWQLLQAPVWAAPLALERAGVRMSDIELMEMHEAFSAQVLSNLHGLSSRSFAREHMGRDEPVGHPPEDRINVTGGSIAVGHPFAATGARVTMQLLREMARRDLELGLVTVCAAGGLGFAMVVERR